MHHTWPVLKNEASVSASAEQSCDLIIGPSGAQSGMQSPEPRAATTSAPLSLNLNAPTVTKTSDSPAASPYTKFNRLTAPAAIGIAGEEPPAVPHPSSVLAPAPPSPPVSPYSKFNKVNSGNADDRNSDRASVDSSPAHGNGLHSNGLNGLHSSSWNREGNSNILNFNFELRSQMNSSPSPDDRSPVSSLGRQRSPASPGRTNYNAFNSPDDNAKKSAVLTNLTNTNAPYANAQAAQLNFGGSPMSRHYQNSDGSVSPEDRLIIGRQGQA